MSKSKIQRDEVTEAQFTILDEQGNKVRARRSFNPVFATGMIAGILFLYAFAVKIGNEADQMPATEQEVLLQMQYERATEIQHKPTVVPHKARIVRQLNRLADSMK